MSETSLTGGNCNAKKMCMAGLFVGPKANFNRADKRWMRKWQAELARSGACGSLKAGLNQKFSSIMACLLTK